MDDPKLTATQMQVVSNIKAQCGNNVNGYTDDEIYGAYEEWEQAGEVGVMVTEIPDILEAMFS